MEIDSVSDDVIQINVGNSNLNRNEKKIEFKICGLTSEESIKSAIESGAFMVGLVDYEPSPRYLSRSRSKELTAYSRMISPTVNTVVLTVNMEDHDLDQVVERIQPDFVQLHGQETPERTHEIKIKFGVSVIKAIGVSTAADLVHVDEFDSVADWLLFDSKPRSERDLPGGNGKSFEWETLNGFCLNSPFLLSGGLNKNNVVNAIKAIHPNAVDVSSGVEQSRGQKEPYLIEEFATTVKNVDLSKIEGN